tara:strand:+ start:1183 stop:4392 length:3210 start_codon:yes stop_codon:yes gene_type:complete
MSHDSSQRHPRVAYGRTLGFGVIVSMTVALSACQDQKPTVSLQEAKKITAKFSGSSFTPPPRTIKDITAILDKEKRADPAAAAKARAEANKEPPAGATKDKLASFYWQRGQAAGKIGDVRRQLADLKEAKRLSKGTFGDTRGRFLFDLGIAQVMAGSWADSIRNLEEAFNNTRSKSGRALSWGATIARLSASAGDLEAADRRLAEAESLYNEAQDWRSWGRWGDVWTRSIRRAEGRILMFKGRYAEAEPVIRASISAAERALSKQTHEADAFLLELTHIDLSRLLRRQGRLVEAEIKARKALTSSLRRVGRYSQDTAYMLRRLAETIGAQGRNQEAGQLARAVIDIYRQTGTSEDSFMMAFVRNQLAGSLVNQGHWKAALSEFDAVKKGMAGDPKTFEQFFAHDLGWALALVGAGRAGEAKSIAEAALRRNERLVGKDNIDTASSLGVLAMALAGMDKQKEAFSAFSQAIPILLSGSRQADDETTTEGAQVKRLGMILETYVGLLADVRGTALEQEAGVDAAAEAFRIAGVARGQSVQRALGASAARAAAKDPALANLVRREQDTQKQLAASYGLLATMLSAPIDQQNPKAAKSLRTSIDQLRAARTALAKEIEKRFPAYAELINPKPATIADARALLRPGEALISTYVGTDKTYVWAVPKKGKVAFAAVKLGRQDLDDSVALLRGALDPQAQTLGDIPEFDLEEAHGLYKALLAPVADGWKSSKSIMVVAHGPLGYLPLSVLPTKETKLGPEKKPLFSNYKDIPWLARTHAVTMLPSVASLKTLRGLPPGDAKRKAFAGFGDPFFNEQQAAEAAKPKPIQTAALASRGLKTRGLPVRLRAAPKTKGVDSAELAILPRLPDTADEVTSIALAMNADLTKSVFLGKDASEGLIKSMDLSGFMVLAFATHGLVPGDLNGLTQPALALSSPRVAGGTDDGLLTMGEILALKLDADWVVLSACNTGSGQGAGAEAVSGLGRAFFYAGTRALLVSNWPVETTSAKILTTDLFRRQAEDPTLSRAEALRQAMVALIDSDGRIDPASGKAQLSYAHPLFWAPFSLIGDGGGGKPGA